MNNPLAIAAQGLLDLKKQYEQWLVSAESIKDAGALFAVLEASCENLQQAIDKYKDHVLVPDEPDPSSKYINRLARYICELDGVSEEESMGLIWQGNPPEPYGDVFNVKYIPDAITFHKAVIEAAKDQS